MKSMQTTKIFTPIIVALRVGIKAVKSCLEQEITL